MNKLNSNERDLLGNGKAFELVYNKRKHLTFLAYIFIVVFIGIVGVAKALEQPPDRISGIVLEKDTDEGLKEVTVILDMDDGDGGFSTVQETVTDSDGNYSFTGFFNHDFKVRLEIKDGWEITTPEEGYHSVKNPWSRTSFRMDFEIDLGDTEVVEFSDQNLEEAVRNELEIPEGDITEEDMLDLTALYGLRQGIEVLHGMEYASNLDTLYLSANNISDIAPLSKLTNLEELNLFGNDISDIETLSCLTNLENLHVGNNKIICINALSDLTNLESLMLFGNDINDIETLSRLTNLEGLWLQENNITNIEVLSELTNLKNLNLGNNNISDISALSHLTNLESLMLFRNDISNIETLSGLTNLKILHLSANNISDISALSKLTNLQTLMLFRNDISNIETLSDLANLEDLNLSSNNITDICALSELTNLERLWLQDNSISDIDVLSDLTKIERLRSRRNKITDISALVDNEGIDDSDIVHINTNPLAPESYTEHISELEERGVDLDYDHPGEIHGTVSDDDTGEGLEDVTVFLDINRDGELNDWEISTVTDADGNYSFDPIGPYEYEVRVKVSEDRLIATPRAEYHSIELSSEETITGLDFELDATEN